MNVGELVRHRVSGETGMVVEVEAEPATGQVPKLLVSQGFGATNWEHAMLLERVQPVRVGLQDPQTTAGGT